jgi:hypothetical protein
MESTQVECWLYLTMDRNNIKRVFDSLAKKMEDVISQIHCYQGKVAKVTKMLSFFY